MALWRVLRRVSRIVVQEAIRPLDQEVLVEGRRLAKKGNRAIGQEFAVAGVRPIVEIDLREPCGTAGPILHMGLGIFFQAALRRHVEGGKDTAAAEHVFGIRAEVIHPRFQ